MPQQYKIQGMDCAEEIAALKKELSPLVGGEHFLSFDLINARLIIQDESNPVDSKIVVQSVKKLGMQAIPWDETQNISETSFLKKHARLIFTCLSAVSILAGFISHGLLHGGLGEAFLVGGGETHAFPMISKILYMTAIVLGGWFIFPRAWNSLRRLSPDMNLLMTVAVIGAVAINEWLEAATVSFLFAVSLLLESWSVARARRATKALLDLASNNARILKADGSEENVLATSVEVGAHIIVRPGERIPLDGHVVSGKSEVNQAPITGESLPVEKTAGATVFAGTINGNGALEIQVDKTSEHSTLSNIIRLVSEAHAQRAPLEQWVEKFARIYTPTVMALAFLLLIIPPLLFSAAWSDWLYRSLVLLVIACPCALVISTPVSIVAALTSAARNGVLIKGGKFIEIPSRLKMIAFDKTGTITMGRLSVAEVVPFNEHTKEELLKIACAIEARSEHPIAKAIVSYARSEGIKFTAAENYQTIQGKGATAKVDGEDYWLGSHRYLEERNQESSDVHKRLEALMQNGHSVVAIGNNAHLCGFITLSDTIRSNAKEVITQLRRLGVDRSVMLTGDNFGTAKLISEKVGIDQFYAELLPQDKVKKIEELAQNGEAIGMVGDGVNDAPAMARATLGIAMGVAGSDAAIETADIALMSDDITKIPWLIEHSRRTVTIIRQNISFSILVKLLFVGLTFGGLSSLWGAIAADTGASLLVIFNGLRLLSERNI